MASLSKANRNQLAKVVLEARGLAEQAAQKALHALGVQDGDPPSHLSENQRLLRRSLRAQARQMGDNPGSGKAAESTRHLGEKIAYDHWHRLLFARFLSENNLLFSQKHGTTVTLADCDDLAFELSLRDGWEVATQCAAQMLPQIFRADDPAGQVEFAPEDKVALRQMVTSLPQEIFNADDSLGWVYQYWQAKRKDDVNRAEIKIGADELAPVTQLFTEDYMVLFLLHNTLGAWWAGKKLAAGLAGKKFATEADVRNALALNGITWDYLRFVNENDNWRPAAGVFEGWPKKAAELRVLDPCMGSGHFPVFALPILAAMRQEEEGLSSSGAVDAALRDNLFGLELDPRCTQIAAFNLAFRAWKTEGFRKLPQLNLACCGLGINAKKEDWLRLANGDVRMQGGMEELYDLFQQAPILGSLIDPKKVGGKIKGQEELLTIGFHELQPLLEKALEKEKIKEDETLCEMGVTANGLAHAAEILAGNFHLVATNVPYLGRRKQGKELKTFCATWHPDAKTDLATCFVERCLTLSAIGGSISLVTPQNWLFLGRYKKLRERLLKEKVWNGLARLGENGFDSPQAAGAFTAMTCLTNGLPMDTNQFSGIDVSEESTPEEKNIGLKEKLVVVVGQKTQFDNPDARVALGEAEEGHILSVYAISMRGIVSGDNDKWERCYWEIPAKIGYWRFLQTTPREAKYCAGKELIIDWSFEGKGMLRPGTTNEAYGKIGIAIGQMRGLPTTLYEGDLYDNNTGVIVPHNPANLPAIWCFCSSPEYNVAVRQIDQSLKVTNATLVKIPFDLPRWQKVAVEKYPHGLPKPFSSDPTQWLFSGHPRNASQPLQVAMARLLGYQWPRQTGSSFPDCPALEPDGLEPHADNDGIVCINSIKGESPAAERLRSIHADAYGKEWSTGKLAELLAQAESEDKTLEEWLRNGFFDQHCRIFHQRPFMWHIWDGRRDGFSALVNYHKLDYRTLEKLTYTYLGDWITRQKTANEAGEEGSDDKLLAARELQNKLKLILEGDAPYDIFVRWKPLEKQPVGWHPDLNDGVRLNIRPFVMAGILRKDPKINWNKDRGKDVKTAPWFKVFKGERLNDHHLTLEEKKKEVVKL